MRWRARPMDEWRRWFLWRPVCIEDKWVWLEWAEWRWEDTPPNPLGVVFWEWRLPHGPNWREFEADIPDER